MAGWDFIPDFSYDSDYAEDAQFKRLIVASNAPVIEKEWNEMQQTILKKIENLALGSVGAGFCVRPQYTYSSETGDLTINSNGLVSVNGAFINVYSDLVIATANKALLLMEVEDVIVNKDTVLKKYGHKSNTTVQPNKIMDSRIQKETSRRVQTQWNIVGVDNLTGYTKVSENQYTLAANPGKIYTVLFEK